MAFLDNSGDILLDAVLTDTGRLRMAQGTFRITKFALADDEIDYSLYNRNDSRGSAYYDLDILSTPVLEAFTDNAAGLKTKLLSIPRTDLLYLPVIKLYTGNPNSQTYVSGAFIIPATDETNAKFVESQVGILGKNRANTITLHQGIDNEARPHTQEMSADLIEEQYIIELDDRFGTVNVPGVDGTRATVSYIDDDNIASYFLTLTQNTDFVQTAASKNLNQLEKKNLSSIAGSRGTILSFNLHVSPQLETNEFLFLRLGDEVNIDGNNYYYIDANIKVMGATTGYRVDIPVRFLRLK